MSAATLCDNATQLLIMRYSAGDGIANTKELVKQLARLHRLRVEMLRTQPLEKREREMWEKLDLGSLYDGLVFLSFVVALRYGQDGKQEALALIGHAGEDALLDEVAVKMGAQGRPLAAQSKYPKVYDPLVAVVRMPAPEQPKALKAFVDGWYRRMKPIAWHDNHNGAEGAYFGYWCFEAALVAMLWDIDDSALQDHPSDPADLTKHYRATA